MTSSCCTRWSYAAVPYSNLRGAIGTFPIGKSSFAAALYSILRGARTPLYSGRVITEILHLQILTLLHMRSCTRARDKPEILHQSLR